jgi:hypothetical protein
MQHLLEIICELMGFGIGIPGRKEAESSQLKGIGRLIGLCIFAFLAMAIAVIAIKVMMS